MFPYALLLWFYLLCHNSCTAGHIQYESCLTVATELGRDAVRCMTWAIITQNHRILIKAGRTKHSQAYCRQFQQTLNTRIRQCFKFRGQTIYVFKGHDVTETKWYQWFKGAQWVTYLIIFCPVIIVRYFLTTSSSNTSQRRQFFHNFKRSLWWCHSSTYLMKQGSRVSHNAVHVDSQLFLISQMLIINKYINIYNEIK